VRLSSVASLPAHTLCVGGDAKSGRVIPGASIPGASIPGASIPGASIPGASIPGALFQAQLSWAHLWVAERRLGASGEFEREVHAQPPGGAGGVWAVAGGAGGGGARGGPRGVDGSPVEGGSGRTR
jgi:hypothetical protein